ncbi:MAG: TIGR04013 family B12-binding domain/radical SAM domain-containing protein [Desulfurococcales archaeon]|nr:TIGR04013 family B12-binding domain/radical SAM domain-containing protein [Desulfurococcales archaeon]
MNAVIVRVGYGARNSAAPIASALKRSRVGARVYLVEEDPLSLARRLASKGMKVVVLYSLSTPLFLEVAEEVARVSREFPVGAGGPHATGAYWQLLRLGVRAAVAGDGEPAAPLLVEALLGERELGEVPNIAFMEGRRFRVTRRVYASLDDYDPHSPELGLYPPIEIMRGCTDRCTFCEVPYHWGGGARFRSVESVARAVRDYVAAGRRDIRFVAPVGFAYMSKDLRTPNVDAIEKLLLAVRREGGKPYLGTFPSETRPELVTEDVLRVVARLAYNRRIAMGLQSGSERMLRLVRRGHGVEEVLEASRLALKYGFTPVVDIIFGLPGEMEEDVRATIMVMEELASMGARLRLHTFIPLPGTPLARSPPGRVHPLYEKAVLRLLGKGVIEGYWREQVELARKVYCLTALDPLPTPEPRPLEPMVSCSDVWRRFSKLLQIPLEA